MYILYAHYLANGITFCNPVRQRQRTAALVQVFKDYTCTAPLQIYPGFLSSPILSSDFVKQIITCTPHINWWVYGVVCFFSFFKPAPPFSSPRGIKRYTKTAQMAEMQEFSKRLSL